MSRSRRHSNNRLVPLSPTTGQPSNTQARTLSRRTLLKSGAFVAAVMVAGGGGILGLGTFDGHLRTPHGHGTPGHIVGALLAGTTCPTAPFLLPTAVFQRTGLGRLLAM